MVGGGIAIGDDLGSQERNDSLVVFTVAKVSALEHERRRSMMATTCRACGREKPAILV